MSTLEEKIKVMQEFKDGKKIECLRLASDAGWISCGKPSWNWTEYNYRVKKEPRVFYIPSYLFSKSFGCAHTEEQYLIAKNHNFHKNTEWIKVVEQI